MKKHGRLPILQVSIGMNNIPKANIHAEPIFDRVFDAARLLAVVIYIAEKIGCFITEASIDCHGLGRYVMSYNLRPEPEHNAKFDCILGILINPALGCNACHPEDDEDIDFYGGQHLSAYRAAEDLIKEWKEEGQCQIWHLTERLKSRKRLSRDDLWDGLKKPEVFKLNPGFQDAAIRHASRR